jgi:hypothetical protein
VVRRIFLSFIAYTKVEIWSADLAIAAFDMGAFRGPCDSVRG